MKRRERNTIRLSSATRDVPPLDCNWKRGIISIALVGSFRRQDTDHRQRHTPDGSYFLFNFDSSADPICAPFSRKLTFPTR